MFIPMGKSRLREISKLDNSDTYATISSERRWGGDGLTDNNKT
jgi:hypothetical protein